MNNASGCLLQLDENIIVTNNHVIESWRNVRSQNSNAQFQVGSFILPIDELLIDTDATLDLATIRFPFSLREDLGYDKLYFQPQSWPQADIEIGNMVYVAGWPGTLRRDGLGFSNIFYVSINAPISDITDRRCIVEFERDQWVLILGLRELAELDRYGGISGGPVFIFDDGQLKLIGFIYEDGANFFDGVQIVL